jgi:peroxiredoxin
MVPLGTTAVSFALPEPVSGKILTLNSLKSEKATAILFICNHCPFVKHVNNELVRLANEYMQKGVSFIAISSNDATEFPEDSPQKMKIISRELKYPFPYLYDESQKVARAYHAACTPDFFIYNSDLKLVYRGQLDESRPSNTIPVTGKDIRTALDSLLANKPVSKQQKASIGCSIKWKNH